MSINSTSKSSPRFRPVGEQGFTLIELSLSLSLAVIVLGCAYACLSAGFAAQKVIEPRADVIQNGRVAIALMTADLRCACVLPGGTDFLGMQRRIGGIQADNLDFATHNYSPARPQEGNFCEVSYFVDVNPKTGQMSLWRRRNPMIALDPLAGGRREEIAVGVRGLQFEYFDGLEWYESWGELNPTPAQESSLRYRGNLLGMPEAVRITLLLESEPRKQGSRSEETEPAPPMIFRAVARLNKATSSLPRSSSTTSDNQQSNSPEAPNQGRPQ